MPDLPAGTVTFLFTDIEGSTPLWEQMPTEMEASLAWHHAILRRAIEKHGGKVTQIIGDEFQSAFRTAPEALLAALESQRGLRDTQWGATGQIRVRMGLHTGPAEPDPKGDAPYTVGHTLNRVGRVRSVACGQQILLSQATKDLVERHLPEGVSLKDLGEHYMKGMSIPEHLYQVVAPDLPSDFPPLASAIQRPNNLPPEMTSFIGREAEIAALNERLSDPSLHLLTLTGAGGTGKTRLALRLAQAALEDFPGGAWLVELAPLSDPALVVTAVAQVLSVRETQGKALDESLAGYLEKKHLLLVLDNCEHLLEECSRLAGFLLHRCPKVVILATSREILNVSGEISFRVPSLSLPGSAQFIAQQVMEYEAVRLFVERARQAVPGFMLDQSNTAAVVSICHRLEGVPLAIELAAARMRVLTAQQIASRLDNVFRLLTGGSRNVLPRQQTLKAAIDWSYSLLTAQEKMMLHRLSVFAGSWTLEAAEAVCAGEGIEADEALDLLTEMGDKSLAQPYQAENGDTRYRMLETVRQYARDRLVEGGGGSAGQAVRDRHLAYYLQLCEQANAKITGPEQVEWVFRLENELENIRLALEWAYDIESPRHIEDGLRLGSALMWFWHYRNRDAEGAGWLQKLLDASDTNLARLPMESEKIPHLLLWIRTRNAACFLARFTLKTYSIDQYGKLLEETIQLCRSIGRPAERELSWALVRRAASHAGEGDFQQAETMFAEALAICRKNHQRFDEANCLYTYSYYFWGDQPKCVAFLNESFSILESLGCTETDLGATVRRYLAIYSPNSSNSERRKKWFAECLQYYLKIGNFRGWASCVTWLFNRFPEPEHLAAADTALAYLRDHEPETNTTDLMARAVAEWSLGHYDRAVSIAREVLGLALKVNCLTDAANAQVLIARCAVSQGNLERAAHDWKAVAAVWRDENAIEEWVRKNALDGLAFYLVATGKVDAAAQVLGAVDAIYRKLYFSNTPRENSEHDAALAAAREALGEKAFSEAWERGKAMSLWQAFQHGLSCVGDDSGGNES